MLRRLLFWVLPTAMIATLWLHGWSKSLSGQQPHARPIDQSEIDEFCRRLGATGHFEVSVDLGPDRETALDEL